MLGRQVLVLLPTLAHLVLLLGRKLAQRFVLLARGLPLSRRELSPRLHLLLHALLLFGAVRRAWTAPAARRPGGGVAVALGYLVGHLLVESWRPFPPRERLDWLWYLTLAAIPIALVEAWRPCPTWLRWAVRLPLWLAVVWASLPVEVRVDASSGWAILTVSDHGLGVPQAQREQIFKPFERTASARHYGGLGLGLFIVHTIVNSYDGTAVVEPREGGGSMFVVRLPQDRSA